MNPASINARGIHCVRCDCKLRSYFVEDFFDAGTGRYKVLKV